MERELKLRPPLVVHVVWHDDPGSRGWDFAQGFHARMSTFRQPPLTGPADTRVERASAAWWTGFAPGIPIRFHVGRDRDGEVVLPRPIDLEEGDRNAVIVIIERAMFDRRRRGWDEWVDRLAGALSGGPRLGLLIPVGAVRSAQSLCRAITGISILPATAGDLTNQESLVQKLLVVLIRLLQASGPQDHPEIEVFLSHAKRGLAQHPADQWKGGEPIAMQIRRFLQQGVQARVFFDRTDLPHASSVDKGIDAALRRSAVLVVLTDAFLERDWCLFEVRRARELERPVLVIDALQQGTTNLGHLFGSCPVVRWDLGVERIVTALLSLLLRDAFDSARLAKLRENKRPGVVYLATPPSLSTLPSLQKLVRADRSSTVVYPDPPMSLEERVGLEGVLPVKWRTLVEHLAHGAAGRDVKQGADLAGLTVGLSISGDETLDRDRVAEVGLVPRHVDDLFCEMARVLVVLGARVATGLDLREGGFTDQVLDVVERHAGRDVAIQDKIVSYLAWPTHLTLAPKELDARRDRVDVIPCDPPEDFPKTLTARRKRVARAWKEQPELIAQAFAEQREHMNWECDARIAFGGKFFGYVGAYPGVLHEIVLALKFEQPVYLLGGLGGVAAAVSAVLAGEDPPAVMTFEGQVAANPDYASLVKEFHVSRPGYVDYGGLCEWLARFGLDGLCRTNGLTEAENRILFKSLNPLELIELVARGLGRRRRAMRSARKKRGRWPGQHP